MTSRTHRERLLAAACIVMFLACCPAVSSAQEKDETIIPAVSSTQEKDETIILDTTGFWRVHYTIKPPVVKKDGKVETLQFRYKWLMRGTPLPQQGWEKPDFGDSSWSRFPGMLNVSPNYHVLAFKSPFVSLECLRGKFNVTDPAKTGTLTLSGYYHGGIVVYLNGTEIARKNLPAGGGGEQLADDYVYAKYDPKKPESKRRELGDVKIPAHLVRKGINVLAVEVHRSAYDNRDVIFEGRRKTKRINWGSCGLASVRLKSSGGNGVKSNFTRPNVFHVWNSDTMQVDTDLDYGDLNEKLKPLYIVGTRNGAFSGKVVIGSPKPVKGFKTVISDLSDRKTGGRISASSVQVRYAKADTTHAGMERRYMEYPRSFGGLEESAPEELKVTVKRARPWSFKPPKTPGIKISFGVVQPVWITVNVPVDAKPGDYEGTLTFSATGVQPVRVPVNVKVCGFKLPDPADFVTWADIIHSPESVAIKYEVPLWSDEHIKLMGKSLKLLSQVGSKVAYVPLICRSNAGNAESMVRWIRQPDGTYKYDFTPMGKYLDLLDTSGIKPSVVCFRVWDTYLEGGRGGAEKYAGKLVKDARASHKDAGPIVSVLDPATGKVEQVALPKYSTPDKSMAMWKPLMTEIRERLRKRGLEKKMMIGISTDNRPTKEVIEFFKKVAPGVPWVSQGHGMPHELHGVPVMYVTGVWSGGKFPADPSVRRTYGWKRLYKGNRTKEWSPAGGGILLHHPRNPWSHFPVTSYRFVGEMNVAGHQRGFARLGADFWSVLKNKRGRLVGTLAARYPETNWRNLGIRSCVLSSNKNGAISTHRFEMIREGMQECEARIFIEKAILDKKITGDLAKKCQEILDERILPMRIGTSLLAEKADSDNTWWNWPGLLGYNWYVGSGWQERSEKLYAAADEVAQTLKK